MVALYSKESITVNFIDPGNGGNGVATYDSTTGKVDNSNIGRRVLLSKNIRLKETDNIFKFSIYCDNPENEKKDFISLDANGIVVGFKQIEHMVPKPLYSDIGLDKDHIESFTLDLSKYLDNDSIEIECEMLRFDYYRTTSSNKDNVSLHEMLKDHPDGNLSDIVIGATGSIYGYFINKTYKVDNKNICIPFGIQKYPKYLVTDFYAISMLKSGSYDEEDFSVNTVVNYVPENILRYAPNLIKLNDFVNYSFDENNTDLINNHTTSIPSLINITKYNKLLTVLDNVYFNIGRINTDFVKSIKIPSTVKTITNPIINWTKNDKINKSSDLVVDFTDYYIGNISLESITYFILGENFKGSFKNLHLSGLNKLVNLYQLSYYFYGITLPDNFTFPELPPNLSDVSYMFYGCKFKNNLQFMPNNYIKISNTLKNELSASGLFVNSIALSGYVPNDTLLITINQNESHKSEFLEIHLNESAVQEKKKSGGWMSKVSPNYVKINNLSNYKILVNIRRLCDYDELIGYDKYPDPEWVNSFLANIINQSYSFSDISSMFSRVYMEMILPSNFWDHLLECTSIDQMFSNYSGFAPTLPLDLFTVKAPKIKKVFSVHFDSYAKHITEFWTIDGIVNKVKDIKSELYYSAKKSDNYFKVPVDWYGESVYSEILNNTTIYENISETSLAVTVIIDMSGYDFKYVVDLGLDAFESNDFHMEITSDLGEKLTLNFDDMTPSFDTDAKTAKFSTTYNMSTKEKYLCITFKYRDTTITKNTNVESLKYSVNYLDFKNRSTSEDIRWSGKAAASRKNLNSGLPTISDDIIAYCDTIHDYKTNPENLFGYNVEAFYVGPVDNDGHSVTNLILSGDVNSINNNIKSLAAWSSQLRPIDENYKVAFIKFNSKNTTLIADNKPCVYYFCDSSINSAEHRFNNYVKSSYSDSKLITNFIKNFTNIIIMANFSDIGVINMRPGISLNNIYPDITSSSLLESISSSSKKYTKLIINEDENREFIFEDFISDINATIENPQILKITAI